MRPVLLGVLTLTGVPAAAQQIMPRVEVLLVEHRVDAGAGIGVTSGLAVGAGVATRFGDRLLASADLGGGKLGASGGGFDRDFAQLRLAAGYQITPWLGLTAGWLTRTFTAPLARQRWTLFVSEATVRLPFAITGLAGVGRVAFAPVVKVSELPSPGAAIMTSAGIEYDVRRFGFALSYAMDRHTFAPQGGSIRSEQLSALTLRLTWRRRP